MATENQYQNKAKSNSKLLNKLNFSSSTRSSKFQPKKIFRDSKQIEFLLPLLDIFLVNFFLIY